MALGRRDEEAVEAIDIAELELEINTKRECVAIMASRVKVVLQGNFEGRTNLVPLQRRDETTSQKLWKNTCFLTGRTRAVPRTHLDVSIYKTASNLQIVLEKTT